MSPDEDGRVDRIKVGRDRFLQTSVSEVVRRPEVTPPLHRLPAVRVRVEDAFLWGRFHEKVLAGIYEHMLKLW
jgi:hypothetical protein